MTPDEQVAFMRRSRNQLIDQFRVIVNESSKPEEVQAATQNVRDIQLQMGSHLTRSTIVSSTYYALLSAQEAKPDVE